MSSPAFSAAAAGAPTELAKVATDMTIVAVLVVVAMILIVSVSTLLLVRFLRGVVDADRRPPPAECAAWLQARRMARGARRESAEPRPASPMELRGAPRL